MYDEQFMKRAIELSAEALTKPGTQPFGAVVVKDDPANTYDSVSEMWFESEEAMAAAFATDGGKAAGADAAAHVSNRVRVVTQEHPEF